MEGEGPSAVLSWAEIEYSMTWAVTKSNLPAWLYCTHREVYQDLIGLTCETKHGQYINYANPNIYIYIYIYTLFDSASTSHVDACEVCFALIPADVPRKNWCAG